MHSSSPPPSASPTRSTSSSSSASSWACRCGLCRDAYELKLPAHRWLDFLCHRDNSVIQASPDEFVTVYITEQGDEMLTLTDGITEPKTPLA